MNEGLFLFQLIVLIFSVMIHEVSHGYVAEYLGDPTARMAGRLTLNPIKHLDFFGSILLPLLLIFAGQPVIGWAKPVPYNPYNLKNPERGGGLIALAGPASNLVIALILGVCIRLLGFSGTSILDLTQANILLVMLVSAVYLNVTLAFVNLIPIPPIDGSKVLSMILPHRARLYVDAFWARIWLIIQERLVISVIVLFIAMPYIIHFIFVVLDPIISFLTIAFTGMTI